MAAAREVFATRGLEATLDDVAAAAGLGTGTAYRHFRNKHELAAEVLAEATEQIAIDAREALTLDDPWAAIVAFFEATAARQAADRGLYQALAGEGRAADKARLWPDIVDAVGRLFERARSAGAIRADAKPEDVVWILAMIGPVFDGPPDLWRRYLAIVLDGLRATGRGPLPSPPPRLSSLDEMVAVSKRHPQNPDPVAP